MNLVQQPWRSVPCEAFTCHGFKSARHRPESFVVLPFGTRSEAGGCRADRADSRNHRLISFDDCGTSNGRCLGPASRPFIAGILILRRKRFRLSPRTQACMSARPAQRVWGMAYRPRLIASTTASPIFAGLGATTIPAASNAATFSVAVPLPPLMIAPA